MSKTIKKLQIVLKNNFDKSQIISKLKKNKILFEKGIYLKKNMSKNSIINFKDIIFKKPAIGIHAKYYKKIIGKKVKKNVKNIMHIKLSICSNILCTSGVTEKKVVTTNDTNT